MFPRPVARTTLRSIRPWSSFLSVGFHARYSRSLIRHWKRWLEGPSQSGRRSSDSLFALSVSVYVVHVFFALCARSLPVRLFSCRPERSSAGLDVDDFAIKIIFGFIFVNVHQFSRNVSQPVDIVFDGSLSAGEQTTLSGLITAHTPDTMVPKSHFFTIVYQLKK